MSRRSDDWLSRQIIPDMYPRKDDPFRPSVAVIPGTAPLGSMMSPQQLGSPHPAYVDWMTPPAQRPVVFQRAINFQIPVTTTPQRLISNQFQCDTIVLDVVSTGGNSIFFGYGSGVTTGSGIEVRPGLPIAITPENNREQWEIQRVLEAIGAMMAAAGNFPPIGLYRAPRVVFDAAEYYVVTGTAITASCMLFYVPELQ